MKMFSANFHGINTHGNCKSSFIVGRFPCLSASLVKIEESIGSKLSNERTFEDSTS